MSIKMKCRLAAALLALCGSMSASVVHAQAPQEEEKVLRICADPNNLPISNQAREGYENKIAELIAQELGWKAEYTWFPQRMGFIRNTLRAKIPNSDRYKCDLVTGVPTGYELTATTKPYLHSTYAMVFVKGKGMDDIQTPEDLLKLPPEKLSNLKLGAFAQTPPIDWLLKHGLINQLIPYTRQSADPAEYPGEIIERDLVDGKLDVAFVWGPIAGYFGKKVTKANVSVVAFKPQPGYQFDFNISMGVRFGEKEWKERIEKLLEANRGKIQAILASYDVPQLDEAGNVIRVSEGAGNQLATGKAQ